MKIGSKLQFDFPDKCPENCKFKDELFYQGSICCRCPLFNCGGEYRLIEPEEYRDDWAEEWQEFFKSGKYLELKFQIERD